MHLKNELSLLDRMPQGAAGKPPHNMLLFLIIFHGLQAQKHCSRQLSLAQATSQTVRASNVLT